MMWTEEAEETDSWSTSFARRILSAITRNPLQTPAGKGNEGETHVDTQQTQQAEKNKTLLHIPKIRS
jgi:hypothetical protein